LTTLKRNYSKETRREKASVPEFQLSVNTGAAAASEKEAIKNV